MKLLPFVVLVVLSASTLPISGAADAAVQRCENSDGEVIYTDRACGSLRSKAIPLPSEVLDRIARDASVQMSTASTPADGAAPRSTITSRRSLQSGCARTPTQLSMDLQGSLALRDVNRLAESYHWVGQSHQQAQQLMQRLGELAQRPVLDARFYDAHIGSGAMELAGSGPAIGVLGIMQLSFTEASSTRVIDFEVLRFSGCYFVRF